LRPRDGGAAVARVRLLNSVSVAVAEDISDIDGRRMGESGESLVAVVAGVDNARR